MKILAVSDIHDQVVAVRELRGREQNEFDLVVLTGDIGGTHLDEIFDVLASFDCPLAYVLGNWDGALVQGFAHAVAVRMQSQELLVGNWRIVGLDEEWLGDDEHRRTLAHLVREGDPVRTIVLTHQRLRRTADDFGPVRLFIFGHIHRHRVTNFRGSTFVCVGALGEVVTVRPDRPRFHRDEYQNALIGTYCIVELSDDGLPIVTNKSIAQDTTGWVPLVREKWPSKPLIQAPFRSEST
jgi:predicted phosphodiesterase